MVMIRRYAPAGPATSDQSRCRNVDLSLADADFGPKRRTGLSGRLTGNPSSEEEMNVSSAEIDTKTRISTLWIVVLFNMLFADIMNFITPGTLQEIMTGYAGSLQINQGILLVFAVLLEIPIAMIFLSRVLKDKANRRANIIACMITIVFTIGGGTANLHYAFFATVEVACMVLIIWHAWRWK
jgi:hypothetical protein